LPYTTLFRSRAHPADGRGRRAGGTGTRAARSANLVTVEVLTVGRVGVDLYPEQSGVGLAEVSTFAKSLGGSATNVAVAAARLGRSAAVVTKVGRGPFGNSVQQVLRSFGVLRYNVSTAMVLETPVLFFTTSPMEDLPLQFCLLPVVPGLSLRPDVLQWYLVELFPLLCVSCTGVNA